MELEEESKRSLAMEAEVEKYLRQLSKHREETNVKLIGGYRVLKAFQFATGFIAIEPFAEEARQRHDLEETLKRARLESEHLRKQLSEAHRVAMSQASLPPPPPPPQQSSATSPGGSSTSSSNQTGTLPNAGSGGGTAGLGASYMATSGDIYGMLNCVANPAGLKSTSFNVRSSHFSNGNQTGGSVDSK